MDGVQWLLFAAVHTNSHLSEIEQLRDVRGRTALRPRGARSSPPSGLQDNEYLGRVSQTPARHIPRCRSVRAAVAILSAFCRSVLCNGTTRDRRYVCVYERPSGASASPACRELPLDLGELAQHLVDARHRMRVGTPTGRTRAGR